MADADWDADDFEPVEVKPPASTDKWEGEDEDDSIKDNWDDDDDAEQEKKTEETTTLPMAKKKKKPIGERIREKEEKRRKELEEKLKKEEEEKANLTPEEINAEKKRRERLQLESDLELAKETFGSTDNDPLCKPSIDRFEPSSRVDFEKFASMLKEKLTKYESSVNYPVFLENLFRDLVIGLSSDDIKKLGSTLNAVANEKQKQERNVKGKKGKKKGPTVNEGKQLDYDDGSYYNEYDDFM